MSLILIYISIQDVSLFYPIFLIYYLSVSVMISKLFINSILYYYLHFPTTKFTNLLSLRSKKYRIAFKIMV